jgi:hypothetical protein
LKIERNKKLIFLRNPQRTKNILKTAVNQQIIQFSFMCAHVLVKKNIHLGRKLAGNSKKTSMGEEKKET